MSSITDDFEKVKDLLGAIIYRAYLDYKQTCEKLRDETSKSKCWYYIKEIREIREFADSQWFKDMNMIEPDIFKKSLKDIEIDILNDDPENVFNSK